MTHESSHRSKEHIALIHNEAKHFLEEHYHLLEYRGLHSLVHISLLEVAIGNNLKSYRNQPFKSNQTPDRLLTDSCQTSDRLLTDSWQTTDWLPTGFQQTHIKHTLKIILEMTSCFNLESWPNRLSKFGYHYTPDRLLTFSWLTPNRLPADSH